MSEQKIGVALIGSGIFIKEQHLPAVLQCPNLTLKAIYSRTLQSATNVSASLAKGVDLYSEDKSDHSYDDLLQREDVHAVIIALPILVQPGFVRKALTAGKHVLAEKPLAKDVATARELLDFYHHTPGVDPAKVNFSLAEQFRFYAAYAHAARKIASFGRVLGFRVRVSFPVKAGGKYFETGWRKQPGYQGGFLLDGGVHYVAGLRHLLQGGGGVRIKRVCAFTTLLQPHLPPVDSVDACFQLDSGVGGTFSISAGSTFTGAEWSVACEGGTVSVDRTVVRSRAVGEEEVVEDVPDVVGERTEGEHTPIGSVVPEVFAWARSLVEGKWNLRQSAEEGLADLEVVEAMLRSGERGGEVVELKWQV